MAKSAAIFLLLQCCLGCHQEAETHDVSDVGGSGGSGGSDVVSPPTPTATSGGSQTSPPEDEGFDPCPEVTYVLWEEGSVKYTITVEVFCEPIQNINLGCPGPMEQNH